MNDVEIIFSLKNFSPNKTMITCQFSGNSDIIIIKTKTKTKTKNIKIKTKKLKLKLKLKLKN